MQRMRSLRLAALLFALVSSLYAQDTRRDGNWWMQQSGLTKTSYVVGFFDGMDLGKQFSGWKYEEDDAFISRVMQSFAFYDDKFLKDVTNDQLADGLDVFYKDFRNRKILVHRAVWLTLNSIAGTPQAELDKLVENFRKNAEK